MAEKVEASFVVNIPQRTAVKDMVEIARALGTDLPLDDGALIIITMLLNRVLDTSTGDLTDFKNALDIIQSEKIPSTFHLLIEGLEEYVA